MFWSAHSFECGIQRRHSLQLIRFERAGAGPERTIPLLERQCQLVGDLYEAWKQLALTNGVLGECSHGPLELRWVRLFHGTFDGRKIDHLTTQRCGRLGGSGFGHKVQLPL